MPMLCDRILYLKKTDESLHLEVGDVEEWKTSASSSEYRGGRGSTSPGAWQPYMYYAYNVWYEHALLLIYS